MSNKFFDSAKEMEQRKEPFAMAFVVNRKVPSSGKPGDKALIRPDGSLEGWIGGGCTKGIIIKEARESLRDGQPRLVHISPEAAETEEKGIKSYHMTCHSGGEVEVYIEPVIPKAHILILGHSHVAMVLSRLAKAMNYSVSVMSANADKDAFPDADNYYTPGKIDEDMILPHTYIVVCTQGEQDEIMLEAALRTKVPYVAFVSSRRKAMAMFKYLRDVNIPIERQQQLRTPAGLDINAKLPEEVAISILAQVVSEIRSEKSEATIEVPELEANPDIYINPVCGVPVQKSTAKHILEHVGEKVYFCCDGCKNSFEQNPDAYTDKVLAQAQS